MIKLFNNNYTYFNSHNFIVATLGAPFHTNATLNANVNSFVSSSVNDIDFGNDKDFFISQCYDVVKEFLDENPHNSELQSHIESFLFDNQKIFDENNSEEFINKLKLNFSRETSEWLIGIDRNINKYLNNFIKEDIDLSNKNISFSKRNNAYTIDVIRVLKPRRVSNLIIANFLNMLSVEFYLGSIDQMDHFSGFGKRLVGLYIYEKYNNYKKANNYKDIYTLSQWKNLNKDEFIHLEDSTVYIPIAGNLLQFLTTESVNVIEYHLERSELRKDRINTVIKIQAKARENLISHNLGVVHTEPVKLPMIVEPKPYILDTDNNIRLGGYLNNDNFMTDKLFIEKVGYQKETTLEPDNKIIDLVNGMSKIPYKINKDTYDYIMQHGIEKNIIVDPNREDIVDFKLRPKKKRTKREIKELKSLVSTSYQENSILRIAETYLSVDKIYFPLRLDQRTRIYCTPQFLNYQSSDLAKGLLSFSNPGVIKKHDIEAINYFKSYGAMLYDGNLSKRSLTYRVKWIDTNKNVILNFRNNSIVNEAENKTSFISFCFEYEKFINFMDDINLVNFSTTLPIQLDASCNGYQHICLLTREEKVFKQLNLKESSKQDKPEDFYNYILFEVLDYIKNKLDNEQYDDDKEKNSLKRLVKFDLNRSIVKKSVMTYSYNTTNYSLVNYIKDMLIERDTPEVIEGNSKPVTVYILNKNNTKDFLTMGDIYNFVRYFILVLKKVFPKMHALKEYTKAIVKICVKLGRSLPWITPSGAMINQSYLESQTLKIRAFAFVKSRYSFKVYINDNYDLRKQTNAAMPNIIHSLDGSSIALLYNLFSKEAKANIFTIHDCFAVTADKVEFLINILKAVYIKIYSDDIYIITLHNYIKESIKLQDKVNWTPDEKYIILKGGERLLYPSIDKIIDKNISIDSLKKSSNLLI